MNVKFSKKFTKQYDKAPQSIKRSFGEKLQIFKINKFDSSLNNHSLVGVYKGYRSINITGDWRAIYQEIGKVVYFESMSTHSQLYR